MAWGIACMVVAQFTAGCTGWQPSSLRGELGPNSAMKSNPGLINPTEKLYTKVRVDCAWVCWLCSAQRWAQGRCTTFPPPKAQRCCSGPAEPRRGMQTYLVLPGGS